ncbi:MAG: sugar isomerase domain-containing protein [Oscillospiraceae bacterium]|nr:sugar isomerase domain-containing protein [Oscillospiraceae bacterium]
MSEFYEQYANVIKNLLDEIIIKEHDNINKAGELIARSIMNGGIIQTFGSGHSYLAALEICGRAGGLIPSKVIEEPSRGDYEMVEGVGEQFCKKIDVQPNDVFIVISNSGRNPMGIEIADFFKSNGVPIIVVTSLEVSRSMSSRHSSGKLLYKFGDVVLDNHGVFGDSIMEMPGMPEKVSASSSFTSMMLLDCAVLYAIEVMLSKGFIPAVFRSANIDGGSEFNEKLQAKYANRLKRV